MTHKNLDTWKDSIKLAGAVYKLTQNFPEDELYGLTCQLKRSVIAVPSNIAKGCARQLSKETIQFLYIGLSSLMELETQLILAKELGYAKNLDKMFDDVIRIKKLILGLIKFHKDKSRKSGNVKNG